MYISGPRSVQRWAVMITGKAKGTEKPFWSKQQGSYMRRPIFPCPRRSKRTWTSFWSPFGGRANNASRLLKNTLCGPLRHPARLLPQALGRADTKGLGKTRKVPRTYLKNELPQKITKSTKKNFKEFCDLCVPCGSQQQE